MTDHQKILSELRRPFTPAAVRFKLQTASMVVAYIDARLVTERLNRVAGLDWSDEYEQLDAQTMLCRLTVCGVTRRDVGVAESRAAGGAKALYSDAFKRAGVKFGIGVSLYSTVRMFAQDGEIATNREGKPVGLKPNAVQRFRGLYAQWLAQYGVAGFGEPLDHGDVDDAQGDTDADTPPVAPDAPARAEGEVTAELVSEFTSQVAGWSDETKMELMRISGCKKPAEFVAKYGDEVKQMNLLLSRLRRETADSASSQGAPGPQRRGRRTPTGVS